MDTSSSSQSPACSNSNNDNVAGRPMNITESAVKSQQIDKADGQMPPMTYREKRKQYKKMRRKRLRRELALLEDEIEERLSKDPVHQARLLAQKYQEEQEYEKAKRIWELKEKQAHLQLFVRNAREEKRSKSQKRTKLKTPSTTKTFVPGQIIPSKVDPSIMAKSIPTPSPPSEPSHNPTIDTNKPATTSLASLKSTIATFISPGLGTSSTSTNTITYPPKFTPISCPFYQKTGACRHGDKCNRNHEYPVSSCCIVIKHIFMFGDHASTVDRATHVSRKQRKLLEDEDKYFFEDSDEEKSKAGSPSALTTTEDTVSDSTNRSNLIHSDGQTIDKHQIETPTVEGAYKEFFAEFFSEFGTYGHVIDFKVCSNLSPQLKGNLYVLFETEEEAAKAWSALNGRFYAGAELLLEYSPVRNFREATCGLFLQQQCPKGSYCNYWHPFANPVAFASDLPSQELVLGTGFKYRQLNDSDDKDRDLERGDYSSRNPNADRSGARSRQSSSARNERSKRSYSRRSRSVSRERERERKKRRRSRSNSRSGRQEGNRNSRTQSSSTEKEMKGRER